MNMNPTCGFVFVAFFSSLFTIMDGRRDGRKDTRSERQMDRRIDGPTGTFSCTDGNGGGTGRIRKIEKGEMKKKM